jgi:hypothetical protein
MSNPWLSIPLEDYEGHMGSAGVRQVFKRTLDRRLPESVAVLGVAGGNGLEQIDCAATKRIVGVDINQRYLDKVQRRFGTLAGLELYCRDLAERDFSLAPVALVHAALIFEHGGLGVALENALSLVAPEGALSVVLQFPSEDEQAVASTSYTSIQTLTQDFALIDISEFQRLLGQNGDSDWLSRKTDHCLPERLCGLVYSSKAVDAYAGRHDTRSHLTPSRRIADVGKVEPPDPA